MLGQFYVAYAISRAIASNFLSGVAPLTTAANWFRRKRGRAMGFNSMAFPLGGSAMTLIGQLVLARSGWRSVFALSGSALLLAGVIPSALLLRRHPEDVGLLPDGEAAPAPEEIETVAQQGPPAEESFTVQEAVRTLTFWLLVGTQTINNIPNAAISYQKVTYYTDQGIEAAIVAGALSAYAFCGAVSAAV